MPAIRSVAKRTALKAARHMKKKGATRAQREDLLHEYGNMASGNFKGFRKIWGNIGSIQRLSMGPDQLRVLRETRAALAENKRVDELDKILQLGELDARIVYLNSLLEKDMAKYPRNR